MDHRQDIDDGESRKAHPTTSPLPILQHPTWLWCLLEQEGTPNLRRLQGGWEPTTEKQTRRKLLFGVTHFWPQMRLFNTSCHEMH